MDVISIYQEWQKFQKEFLNMILNMLVIGTYQMGTNLQMGFFPYVVYNFLKLLIGSPRNHF